MNLRDGARLYLRDWRERRGLTQRALREMTGVSITTISTIENGHTQGIDFATLTAIARALDVCPGALFCEPGDLFELDRT
jgi:transcriptional regulator with XRE-family HTH domain